MRTLFRTTTLAALALATTALTAQAQQKQFGVLAGVGIADVNGDDIVDSDSKTGFVGGLYYAFPVGTSIAIEPEALYAMKGARNDELDLSFNLDYIEVPVLVKYSFNTTGGPYLLAGPAIGFNMNCSQSDDTNEVDCEDLGAKAPTTFGGVVGIGFQKSRFGLEARYDFDFSDAIEASDGTSVDAKNAVWEILARIAIK